jgi:hypothetical protein
LTGASSDRPLWFALDAELTIGAAWRHDFFQLRSEIGVGGVYGTLVSAMGTPSYQMLGPRGGFRVKAAVKIAPGLWLEAGPGWDVVYQAALDTQPNPLDERPLLSQLNFEIGLQWAR